MSGSIGGKQSWREAGTDVQERLLHLDIAKDVARELGIPVLRVEAHPAPAALALGGSV